MTTTLIIPRDRYTVSLDSVPFYSSAQKLQFLVHQIAGPGEITFGLDVGVPGDGWARLYTATSPVDGFDPPTLYTIHNHLWPMTPFNAWHFTKKLYVPKNAPLRVHVELSADFAVYSVLMQGANSLIEAAA